jgi:hypothetical protein
MLLPIQASPKIRKGKSNTAKISSKIAGLTMSQFDEDMESGEDTEDMDSGENMENTDSAGDMEE